MPLLTTAIGSHPKPADCPVPGWVADRARRPDQPTRTYTEFLADRPPDATARLDRMTQEAVRAQVAAGIDVPSEGEIRREHYIYYHLRHLGGVSFADLTETVMRGGNWRGSVPTVTAPVEAGQPFLVADWQTAQAATSRPVKITIPGPLTIIDSIADRHYGAPERLARDLARALNVEIRRLAAAGCRWIQVDEPVFARKPEAALAYGIDALALCFHGLDRAVARVVHICCGYPKALDLDDYAKADAGAYFELAGALDAAPIDVVSLEDAHRPNDLGLLERFTRTKVILGVVQIARSEVETVASIQARLRAALGHIEPERLIAGPDCGLIMLDPATALAKLRHLAEAAHGLP
jgi:5-methyltetrahydropteroyltriglutamate--homocysteine methyltransferase